VRASGRLAGLSRTAVLPRPGPNQLAIRFLSTRTRPAPQEQSRSWSYHRSHSSRSAGRATQAVSPFFFLCGTPLLCESAPHLADIKANVDKPDAKEFLIAHGKELEDDDEPPSILRRILRFLRDRILEPLSTATRFLHLAILFAPVILASPILLLEVLDDRRDRRRGRQSDESERATTKWWYRFLVHQMERAGPTFIKVRFLR
jgi:aarF domain-containing kinase